MPDFGRSRLPERITIIGLGRFGSSAARELNMLGYEVMAIDRDERVIREAAEYVTLAAQGDGTDPELLRQLNVNLSDVVIVAQGENLEASVLTTLLAKKIGVKWVISKAKTVLHGELLQRVGADQVVFPEMDAGIRLAHSLGVRDIRDYITLSPTSGIAKIAVPLHMVGRSFADVTQGLSQTLTIFLLKRGSTITPNPAPATVLAEGDELVVAGADADIERFAERGLANRTMPPT